MRGCWELAECWEAEEPDAQSGLEPREAHNQDHGLTSPLLTLSPGRHCPLRGKTDSLPALPLAPLAPGLKKLRERGSVAIQGLDLYPLQWSGMALDFLASLVGIPQK